jgi:hypothetical protein
MGYLIGKGSFSITTGQVDRDTLLGIPTTKRLGNMVFRTRTGPQHLRYSYSTSVFRGRVRVPFH